MSSVIKVCVTLIFIIGIIGMMYFFPRFLVAQWGAENPWTSYLYLYGFGFIFFAIGIYMALKSKACQWGRGRDKLWLKLMICGYVFLALFHGTWIHFAISYSFYGD